MRLYSYWRSSSAWRVRIGLQVKGVPCEIVPIHLIRGGGEQFRPAFLRVNPQAQVPVLEVEAEGPGGAPFHLTQSMAILAYLDERHPTPPLLPPDPVGRARARQLAEVVNAGIQPFQNLTLQNAIKEVGVDPRPLVKAFNEQGLAALETLADLYLIPQLYGARRNGVDVEAYPTLRRVERVCEVLPAFQAAHPDAQPDRET